MNTTKARLTMRHSLFQFLLSRPLSVLTNGLSWGKVGHHDHDLNIRVVGIPRCKTFDLPVASRMYYVNACCFKAADLHNIFENH